MQRSMIAMAVSGLFAAQAAQPAAGGGTSAEVHDATPAIKSRSGMPKMLSGEAIKVFFEGDGATKDQAAIAKAEKSRMAWLIGLMFERAEDGKMSPKVDAKAVKDAASDYLKAKMAESGWKGGKGSGKPPAVVKSARNRVGEIKNLYGAIRFGGLAFEPGTAGYHDLTAQARTILTEANIGWDGVPKPDEAERAARKIAAQEEAVTESALQAMTDKARELGRRLTADERQAIIADAENVYAKAKAEEIAAAVVATYGTDIAEQVAALIPQAIEQHLAAKEQQE